jgi:CRP-like cAMP-binding protein
MKEKEDIYYLSLRKAIEQYVDLSDLAWEAFRESCQLQELSKGEWLLRAGQVARSIHFVVKGALRSYYTDEEGRIYNKNLFLDNSFAASKVSLLKKTPSYFTIEALEDTCLLNINFSRYKELQEKFPEIKNFYIAYIEQNWIVVKESIEIALVLENAKDRYLKLLNKHPDIEKRIAQRHIAAHLGISPTQLSRIRKNLKK